LSSLRERHHRLPRPAKQAEGQINEDRPGRVDLLYLNGHDLRRLPLIERKAN
jgi:hypothetical protein